MQSLRSPQAIRQVPNQYYPAQQPLKYVQNLHQQSPQQFRSFQSPALLRHDSHQQLNHSIQSQLPTPQAFVPQVRTQQQFDQMRSVDVEQIEQPWRIKVKELEDELYRSRGQRIGGSRLGSLTQIEDDNKDQELSAAYSQIQQLLNTVKNLQEEIQEGSNKLEIKQNHIDNLQRQTTDKDREIEELQQYIQMLQQQLDDSANQIEEKNKYLYEEVNIWKRKFIQQNKELHEKQEELMQVYADFENFQNQVLSKPN